MTCLPVYLLIRPLLAQRRVLELGQPIPGAQEILQESGAAEIVRWRPPELAAEPHLFEELCSQAGGRFDVVLGLELLDGASAEERERYLSGLGQLLRPEGLAILGMRNASVPLLGETPAGAGGLDYWSFARLLGNHFPRLALLAQSPMRGFYLSFLQPPVPAESLSLLDDLVTQPEEASHFVAVASHRELPDLPPYLLVSLPYQPLAVSLEGVERELRTELQGARAELERLGGRLRGGEEQLLRLAGRAARVDRLEAELLRQRQLEEELLGARGELAEVAAQIARQREVAAGLQRELEDARAANQDLTTMAQQAQQAATQLALERDQFSSRHSGLIEGQRELVSEFERAKIRELQWQAREEALQQERALLLSQIDEAGAAATRVLGESEQLRERLHLIERERDHLREALLGLEEQEERREAARRLDRTAVQQLEERVLELSAELSAEKRQGQQLQARVWELEPVRVAAGAAQRELAERERLIEGLEERLRDRDRALQEAGEQQQAQELQHRELAIESERRGAELAARQREAEEARTRIGQGLLRIAELEGELEEAQAALATARAEDLERGAAHERAEQELTAATARLASGQQERQVLEAEVQRLAAETERLATEGAARGRKAEELGEEVERLQGELLGKAGELSAAEQRRVKLGSELEQLRSQLAEEDRRRADLQSELGRAWQRGMGAEQLVDELKSELDQMRWAIQVDAQALEEERARARTGQARLLELEDQLKEAQQGLDDREGKLVDLQGELRSSQQSLEALQGEGTELRATVERYAEEMQRTEAALRSSLDEVDQLHRHLADEEARRLRERALEADLRARQEELDSLRQRAELLERQLTEQQGELGRLRDENQRTLAAQQELKTVLEGRERLHRRELGNQQQQTEAHRQERERLDRELRERGEELEERRLRLGEARQAITDLEARLRNQVQDRAALEWRQTTTEEALSGARARVEELTGELDTLRPRLAAAEERLAARDAEDRSLEREATSLRAQVQQLEPRLVEARRQVADARRDLERARHELARQRGAARAEASLEASRLGQASSLAPLPPRAATPPPTPALQPTPAAPASPESAAPTGSRRQTDPTSEQLVRQSRSESAAPRAPAVRPPSDILMPVDTSPDAAEWRQDQPTRPSLKAAEAVGLAPRSTRPGYGKEAAAAPPAELDQTERTQRSQPPEPPGDDDDDEEAITAATRLIQELVGDDDDRTER